MGEYNKNIKRIYIRFRLIKIVNIIISFFEKILLKDETTLYNQVAFFSLIAPLMIFVLRLMYKTSNSDLYFFIVLIMILICISWILYSIVKKKSILFNFFIAIISISIFFILKFRGHDFLDSIINNWYVITGVVVLIMFIFSLLSISSLMRTSNKKLFIGLIKYSVGCSLISIYISFLMVGAGNINVKGVSDIISNLTVLITSIFFFIDGIHDIYDYLEEKDKECRDKTTREMYIKFGMKKKYIFKRIMFFYRGYIFLFFCIMYIATIRACNIDLNKIATEYLKYIPDIVFLLVSFLSAIVVFPFGDAYIDFIRGNYTINDKDFVELQDEMREKMKISKCSKLNPKYIRYFIGNFIVNKIFEDIKVHDGGFISDEEKRFYFKRYVKLNDNNAMKIEYKDIENCEWCTITNESDKFIGDGFVLKKENKSYIFVFVTPFKRGRGFGSLILKELEKKVETAEKYVQIRDKTRNKEMKTFMLLKNNYDQLLD